MIKSSQLWVGTLSVGPGGGPLNSSYENRSTDLYKQELGNTIGQSCRSEPILEYSTWRSELRQYRSQRIVGVFSFIQCPHLLHRSLENLHSE